MRSFAEKGESVRAQLSVVCAIIVLCSFACKVDPPIRTYRFEGVIVAIDKDQHSLRIEHGDIVDLMDAMTMDFPVKDAALLTRIKVGDHVNGILGDDGHRPWVKELTVKTSTR